MILNLLDLPARASEAMAMSGKYWFFILLLCSTAEAYDRCPLRSEVWNLYQDQDGCPDGVELTLRVTDISGIPVANVIVQIKAPSKRYSVKLPATSTGMASLGTTGLHVDMPLFVPPGSSGIDVVNGWHPSQSGFFPYAAEAREPAPWEYAIRATTGHKGIARFKGLRPGTPIEVTLNGLAASPTLQNVPEQNTVVELVL